MDEDRLRHLATRLAERCLERQLMLMTAESCTGGWVAKICTDLAGSSGWFAQGFVTYSNTAKQQMLDVSVETLHAHGAVSEPVVREMTAGALTRGCGNLAVAISGIAGPTGGSAEKPAGTVWFAWQLSGRHAVTRRVLFDGNREAVRFQAVETALQGLIDLAGR
jgi:nicotinamide-nucleotide amidase